MGSTNKTPNLNLPIFSDGDRPTWRGDINDAMNVIDADNHDLRANESLRVDAHLSGGADSLAGTFSVKASGDTGTAASGPVTRVGFPGNAIASDVGIAGIIGGGGTNWENVIGGSTANVGVANHASNLPATPGINPPPSYSFIWGGYDNVVNGWACQVQGYHCTIEAGSNHDTIGGGSIHKIGANTTYSTLSGGTQNTIGANVTHSTIAGGLTNTILDGSTMGAIGGGRSNTVSNQNGTVSGGYQNTSSGLASSITGGFQNTATANYASVLGGLTGQAIGVCSTVLGGKNNVTNADYSIAMGNGAITTNVGEFARASGNFAVPGDAQTSNIDLRQTSINATPIALWTASQGTPIIPENTTWGVTCIVVGRRTDVKGENVAWRVTSCVKRDTGSTAALVGTPTITVMGQAVGSTWAVAHTVDSTGAVRFTVTGEAGKTIRWMGSLTFSQIQG